MVERLMEFEDKTVQTDKINRGFTELDKKKATITDGSGSTGYVKLGNMMIQWGVGASKTANAGSVGALYYSSDDAITFPVAFKTGTLPVVTLGLSGSVGGIWPNSRDVTRTGFTGSIISWGSGAVASINWIAIGVWQ